MIEINFRNAVWFGLILISAGVTWGMLSQRLEAIETKQQMLEKAVIEDIPDIRERVIRLEVLLEQALSE